ncbi:MAG: SemiSWEET transporter [Fusobacterium sp. JB021]|nr:SemiSWEET transporter [Fusobacterium sp. JB020]MDP0494382.1 SemiSWEET transporter [Fusobacterium sp. JB021]MDP0506734.1 SemiSWEET transporter [Fusobacterium sp. JB019]
METLGLIAAVLTTLSFLPQVMQVIKTKDTKSISLGMYSMFVLGVVLWAVYGFLMNDRPVFIANLITFFLSFIILIYKIIEIRRN